MVLVTEFGVVIEGDFAVERFQRVVGETGERVDLDERRVFLHENVPQSLCENDGLLNEHLGEPGFGDDLTGLGLVDTGQRVDRDLVHGVGVGLGDLFDLHAAFDTGDAEIIAIGAIKQIAEIIFLGNVGGRCNEHPVDGESLDLHTEDGFGMCLGLIGGLGKLDAAGLSAATSLDLRLDDDDSELLCSGLRLVGSIGDDSQSY